MERKIPGLAGKALRRLTKGILPYTGSIISRFPPSWIKNELCPSQMSEFPTTPSSDCKKCTFGFQRIFRFSFRCGFAESLHFSTLTGPGRQRCWRLKNFPPLVGFPLQRGLTEVRCSFRRNMTLRIGKIYRLNKSFKKASSSSSSPFSRSSLSSNVSSSSRSRSSATVSLSSSTSTNE